MEDERFVQETEPDTVRCRHCYDDIFPVVTASGRWYRTRNRAMTGAVMCIPGVPHEPLPVIA